VAAKIVRQSNKIALLGAPTSAAATVPGGEKAPEALRAAGLVAKLQSLGYEVSDLGDDPVQLYGADDESPRARNVRKVIASLDALKLKVEQAVKSGALPLILSGDCSVALATVAGARRYFRNLSMIYLDRDADLHTPATTPTGSVDTMVVSHLTGRGAAELVRFWPEPPLVREPDLALFGLERVDPAEEQVLSRSPLRRYLAADIHRAGPRESAAIAIERVHGRGNDFVLHLDVDVIADFQATNNPGSGGLTLDEVRDALEVFAAQKHLAAIEITGYNPAKDPDGSGAKVIVDLLGSVLGKRAEAMKAAAEAADASGAPAAAAKPASPSEATSPSAKEGAASEGPATVSAAGQAQATQQPAAPASDVAPIAAGKAWSSDSIEGDSIETDSLETEADASNTLEKDALEETNSRPGAAAPSEETSSISESVDESGSESGSKSGVESANESSNGSRESSDESGAPN
jgi:arginase